MKLTAITVWNDDPRTGCVASCPEFGISASGSDPFEARDRLKTEVAAWMRKHEGAWPLKAGVTEFEIKPSEYEKK